MKKSKITNNIYNICGKNIKKYEKNKKLHKTNYVQECRLWDIKLAVLIFLNLKIVKNLLQILKFLVFPKH